MNKPQFADHLRTTGRILVCGGRSFGVPKWCGSEEEMIADTARQVREQKLLSDTLDRLARERQTSVIIHGAAAGADRHAGRWAAKHGIQTMPFPADWSLGPRAGPLRNQRMIDEGEPDLVVAFPGGRGTADMVRRAKAAGIEVIQPVCGGRG